MKNSFTHVSFLLVCSILCITASAQNNNQLHLDRVFQDLHSTDASVRDSANSAIIVVLKADLPNIERYSGVLCGSLSDPNAYIRQQASGILNVLSQLYPEHNDVITECSDALVTAASDPVTRVSGNAISVIANMPGGPPASARLVLSNTLADPTSMHHSGAAIGLLRLSHSSDPDGVAKVVEALKKSPDATAKITILNAITQAGVPARNLSDAVSTFLYDHDPDVQVSAICALAASEPNPAATITQLQNLQSSSLLAADVKHIASITAEHLAEQRRN